MSNQSRSATVPAVWPTSDTAVTDESNSVRAAVSYYKTGQRGYYLSLMPVKVNGIYESTMLFDDRGMRMFLQAAPRFNQKAFDALADKVLAQVDKMAALLVAGDKDAIAKLVAPDALPSAQRSPTL